MAPAQKPSKLRLSQLAQTHPGKMKHDLFKLEGLSLSNVIWKH